MWKVWTLVQRDVYRMAPSWRGLVVLPGTPVMVFTLKHCLVFGVTERRVCQVNRILAARFPSLRGWRG